MRQDSRAKEKVTSNTANRLILVDAARGLAIVLMVGYHLAFDLSWFGLIETIEFNHHTGWLAFRAFIVASFLGISGVSLGWLSMRGINPARYWTGVAKLAGATFLVTIASLIVFPGSAIFFGVLHCLLLCRLVGVSVAGRPALCLAMGAFILLAGLFYSNPVFNTPGLQWIGFTTSRPITEDYVPVSPWMGVFFLGLGFAEQAGKLAVHVQPRMKGRVWTDRKSVV